MSAHVPVETAFCSTCKREVAVVHGRLHWHLVYPGATARCPRRVPQNSPAPAPSTGQGEQNSPAPAPAP